VLYPELAPRKIYANKEEDMTKGKTEHEKKDKGPENSNQCIKKNNQDGQVDKVISDSFPRMLTSGKIVKNPQDWNAVVDKKDQRNNDTIKPRLDEPPNSLCGEKREEAEGTYNKEEEEEVHNSTTSSKDQVEQLNEQGYALTQGKITVEATSIGWEEAQHSRSSCHFSGQSMKIEGEYEGE
ncbi:hypothetical protein HAX54_009344, partial [Datura stramonium]|nr:hypothetical protein [Datura stramonium]